MIHFLNRHWHDLLLGLIVGTVTELNGVHVVEWRYWAITLPIYAGIKLYGAKEKHNAKQETD